MHDMHQRSGLVLTSKSRVIYIECIDTQKLVRGFVLDHFYTMFLALRLVFLFIVNC